MAALTQCQTCIPKKVPKQTHTFAPVMEWEYNDPETIFRAIYDQEFDKFQDQIKRRHAAAKRDNGRYIVALHGSHMSVESIIENFQHRVNPATNSNLVQKRAEMNTIKIDQKMATNEFTVHMKSLPGHSSCDLKDSNDKPLMPASFLMNGSNCKANGRRAPIDQISNTEIDEMMNGIESPMMKNILAKQFGLNMFWGPDEDVPNFSMQGDHTEALPGVLFMATYVWLWGFTHWNGLHTNEEYPPVLRLIETGVGAVTRSNKGPTITSAFLFGDARNAIRNLRMELIDEEGREDDKMEEDDEKFIENTNIPIHHFISACQVISTDLLRPGNTTKAKIKAASPTDSLKHIKSMYHQGLYNMTQFDNYLHPSPSSIPKYTRHSSQDMAETRMGRRDGSITREKFGELKECSVISAPPEDSIQVDWLPESALRENKLLPYDIWRISKGDLTDIDNKKFIPNDIPTQNHFENFKSYAFKTITSTKKTKRKREKQPAPSETKKGSKKEKGSKKNATSNAKRAKILSAVERLGGMGKKTKKKKGKKQKGNQREEYLQLKWLYSIW